MSLASKVPPLHLRTSRKASIVELYTIDYVYPFVYLSSSDAIEKCPKMVSIDLDGHNYLLGGHSLQEHIVALLSATSATNYDPSSLSIIALNPEYIEERDQLILTWIFSSVTKNALAQVVSTRYLNQCGQLFKLYLLSLHKHGFTILKKVSFILPRVSHYARLYQEDQILC